MTQPDRAPAGGARPPNQAPGLETFTVYHNPSDYPGRYVVRRHAITDGALVPDAEPLAVTDNLIAARVAVPDGLYNLGRFPADDPAILEVWI